MAIVYEQVSRKHEIQSIRCENVSTRYRHCKNKATSQKNIFAVGKDRTCAETPSVLKTDALTTRPPQPNR